MQTSALTPWLTSKRTSLKLLPWAVLTISLATTVLFCENQRHFTQLERERAERTLAGDVIDAIKAKLTTNQAILDAVAGLFQASNAVTRAEFTAFYDSLNLRNNNLNGIQGVGYAALIPNNDIKAFEQQIRADGQPGFTVKPPGKRAITTAIVFLQPNDWRNQRAKGFDMYSEATRRAAMADAVATGETTLSGPVRLLQETKTKPQVGLLLYTPVYNQPHQLFGSEQERFKALRGWSYSPLRMNDLINSALASVNNQRKHNAQLVIYDGEQAKSESLLYRTPGFEHPQGTWSDLTFANRTWLVGVQLGESQLEASGLSRALLVTLLFGVSLSATAALLTRMLVNNHLALREALVNEKNAALELALANTVFETSPVGIVVTDTEGMIVRINPAFTQLSGYSAIEASGHKTNLLKSGRHDASFYRDLWETIIEKGHWGGEIWNRHANGQIRRHELSITAVRNGNNQTINYLGLLRDVTDRYDQEERMRHMATHDQLTGLPNRALLMDRLSHALATGRRQNRRVGLLFIDLNGFKPVNDRFGHAVGDQLLQAVADRLQARLRESDTLCRHGGDEFVLLVPDAPAMELLMTVAHKLQKWLQEPYPHLPEEIAISGSIGIARWPDHGSNAEALLIAADNAMYVAKEAGGDYIAVAPPEQHQSTSSPPNATRGSGADRTDVPSPNGAGDGGLDDGSGAAAPFPGGAGG